MYQIVLLLCCITAICHVRGEDDKKWVWRDNNRNDQARDASARYEVFEDDRPPFSSNLNGPVGFNNNNNNRPNYVNRPLVNGGGINRPLGGAFGPQRPNGGIYGGNQDQDYYPDTSGSSQNAAGILTGPIPSWVNDGPYKNYDKCKCTERFNCNSPGISYGHCDVGKKYCCYSTKKSDQLGGPFPSGRPVHSPENGILVGPGGPVDGPYGRPGNNFHPQRPDIGGPIRGGNNYPSRPGGGYPNTRPIGGGRPGFGLGGGNRPIHSPENGVLVGPGGPFDRPAGGGNGNYGGYGGYGGRSTKN